MFCFHCFVEDWIVELHELQSRAARRQEPSSRGASGLTSADSGLQLDLAIALSGVSAKIQPLGLIQPRRRCVETSDDVTEELFTIIAAICRALFTGGSCPIGD